MALRDCSEFTQIIYELARHVAQSGGSSVDDVVRAIGVPEITRQTVIDSLYEASTSRTRAIADAKARMAQITREAGLSKRQKKELDRIVEAIERGEMPTKEAVRRTRQDTKELGELALDTRRMKEALKNIEKYVKVEDLNEVLGSGELLAQTPPAVTDSGDAHIEEIREQRGVISEEERQIRAAGRNAELLLHEQAGTIPPTKPRAERTPKMQEILDQRASILRNIRDSQTAKAIRDAKTVAQLKEAVDKLHQHLNDGTLPEIKKAEVRSAEVQKWVELRREAEKALSKSEPAVREKLTRDIDRLLLRLQDSDFAAPVNEKSLPASKAVADLEFERDHIRKIINQHIRDARAKSAAEVLAQQSVGFKALKASFDLPPVFRQGVFFAFTDPKLVLKNFAHAIKTMGPDSEQNYHKAAQELRNRATFSLFMRDGLAIKDIDAMNISAAIRGGVNPAEAARGGGDYSIDDYAKVGLLTKLGWPGKLMQGGIDRSGRGFTTFLNGMRADVYEKWADAYTKTGIPDAQEGEYIARMVNILTGEGNLGHFERYAPALNVLLFSPRNFVAKLQSTITEPLKAIVAEGAQVTGIHEIPWPGTDQKFKLVNIAGTGALRKAVAAQYAKYIAANMGFYTLLALAFQDDEDMKIITDPTNSMAGTVRIGNTYIDPLGGMRPTLVMLSRLASGKKTNAKGKTESIYGEDVPYRGDTALSLVLKQLRGKAAPVPGIVVSALNNRKAYDGSDMSFLGVTNDLVVPMSWMDIYQAFEDQGLSRGAAISGLIMLGMGANTFKISEKDRRKVDPRFRNFQR